MGKLVLERKRYLDGREEIFQCELLYLDEKRGVVKYITHKPHRVGGLFLPSGTVSYGFFFKNQPFVLYRWISPAGEHLGDYFSIADNIELSEDELSWRDLFVDVLIRPFGKIEVLDEEEVPDGLEKSLLEYIRTAKERILSTYSHVLEKADEMMENLWWRKG